MKNQTKNININDTNNKNEGQIKVIIDSKEYYGNENETILNVAQRSSIHISTLCFHEKIKPHGACRLCLVEIIKAGKSKLVASCAYPIEQGLIVETDSPKVNDVKKHLTELYLAMYPYHPEIKRLAKKYSLNNIRYKKVYNYCILCGLCVRYCSEVKGYNAIGFVGRGINKKVSFIPDSSYFKYCLNCMECADICPTGVFPSNYGIERIPQVSDS